MMHEDDRQAAMTWEIPAEWINDCNCLTVTAATPNADVSVLWQPLATWAYLFGDFTPDQLRAIADHIDKHRKEG